MTRSRLACTLAGLLAFGVAEARAQGPGGPGGPGGRGFPMSPLMTALDADGDGELSPKEIENAPIVLKTLDKDKDGKLSAAELRPAGGPGGRGGPGMGGGGNPAEMVARLMSFDKDGDGKLSKTELPERLQAIMDRGDVNKDGFLDKDELGKMAERRGGPGGPGGRGGRGGPDRDN